MDKICYTLAVRQRKCQNGISTSVDNVYTNVANNSVIQLSFGYTITVISKSCNFVTIQISNPNQIPNLIFNIPSASYKVFDLPTESGTLRVFIGATCIDCEETIVCCSI